jgi:hypothetical protein
MMAKKTFGAVLLCAVLFPAALTAAYHLGFGIRADAVSGGLEFRIYAPIGEKTAIYIAPHLIGGAVNQHDTLKFAYSAGLRTGVIFRLDRWASPFFGFSAGHTRASEDVLPTQIGGRAYVGIALSPFGYLSIEEEEESALNGLRFEIETGFMYRYRLGDSYFENRPREVFRVPDIGASVVFSW